MLIMTNTPNMTHMTNMPNLFVHWGAGGLGAVRRSSLFFRGGGAPSEPHTHTLLPPSPMTDGLSEPAPSMTISTYEDAGESRNGTGQGSSYDARTKRGPHKTTKSDGSSSRTSLQGLVELSTFRPIPAVVRDPTNDLIIGIEKK
jgi:hypothetical protein